MWKSVPQMPMRRMRISTSSAPRSGSGRSSKASSPGLRQTMVFMPFMPREPPRSAIGGFHEEERARSADVPSRRSTHHLAVGPDDALRQDDIAVEPALGRGDDRKALLRPVVEGEPLQHGDLI